MEGKIYKNFTDLEVWQKARQLKNEIQEIIAAFPAQEKYRLEDQLIRSSRSIGSNIAEGYGRFTYKDQIHYCVQARGSLFESINHIIDAKDCNYISEDTFIRISHRLSELEKLLNGYIAWLRKMIKT